MFLFVVVRVTMKIFMSSLKLLVTGQKRWTTSSIFLVVKAFNDEKIYFQQPIFLSLEISFLVMIVWDLKAVGQDIPEDEQALIMIWGLPDTDLRQNFSLVMAHNNNIKTFKAISKHLELEGERQKSRAPPSVALVAKESKPEGKSAFYAKQATKGPHTPQNSRPGKGIAKKHKAKGNGDKSIAHRAITVGGKGHMLGIVPSQQGTLSHQNSWSKCVFPCICC